MNDPASDPERLDHTALSLVPLFDNSDEREYWHSRSAAERIRHIETLRRINYGPQATARLQRVLELAPLERR